jgi:hypothetical protein
MTRVVAVVTTVVAPFTTPCGTPPDPAPVANAASSSRSFASASSPGSCSPKFVSSRTSYDPKTHAAAFCGVTTMLPTVGEPSVTIVPSVSHAAVTPALLTPFHVLLVVVLTLLIRRHGFAEPAFVRMMVGVLLPLASGDEGPGHFCLALHLSHRCRPDYIFNSSPAQICRLRRSAGVASRVVSTDSPARVASVFPFGLAGFTDTAWFSLARHRARRPQLDRARTEASTRRWPGSATARHAAPRPAGSPGTPGTLPGSPGCRSAGCAGRCCCR